MTQGRGSCNRRGDLKEADIKQPSRPKMANAPSATAHDAPTPPPEAPTEFDAPIYGVFGVGAKPPTSSERATAKTFPALASAPEWEREAMAAFAEEPPDEIPTFRLAARRRSFSRSTACLAQPCRGSATRASPSSSSLCQQAWLSLDETLTNAA